MSRPSRALVSLLLASVLVSSGCKKEKRSPEDQVREVMDKVREAAASARVGELRDWISDDYKDARGQDKEVLAQLLRFHYLRHRHHNVYSHVRDVVVLEPERVKVTAVAALVGERIERPDQLRGTGARMMRFSFFFVPDGDTWRVVNADWDRASFEDFLP